MASHGSQTPRSGLDSTEQTDMESMWVYWYIVTVYKSGATRNQSHILFYSVLFYVTN